MADRLKDWARVIKRDVHALYLASRDPRVPWYAKALAIVIACYALSPIGLIPDFGRSWAISMMSSCCPLGSSW